MFLLLLLLLLVVVLVFFFFATALFVVSRRSAASSKSPRNRETERVPLVEGGGDECDFCGCCFDIDDNASWSTCWSTAETSFEDSVVAVNEGAVVVVVVVGAAVSVVLCSLLLRLQTMGMLLLLPLFSGGLGILFLH